MQSTKLLEATCFDFNQLKTQVSVSESNREINQPELKTRGNFFFLFSGFFLLF